MVQIATSNCRQRVWSLVRGGALAGAIAVAALVQNAPARAQEAPPRETQPQGSLALFGMVGIVPGQTARLNAVFVALPDDTAPDGGTPPDGGVAGHVHLALLDAAGNRLGEASGEVRAGEAIHVDYVMPIRGGTGADGRRAGPTVAERLQIHARVLGVGPSPFRTSPILATLEIFDTQTGQTSLVLNPAVLLGFNPQPEPPGIP